MRRGTDHVGGDGRDYAATHLARRAVSSFQQRLRGGAGHAGVDAVCGLDRLVFDLAAFE